MFRQFSQRLQQRKPAYVLCSFFPIRFFSLRPFNNRLSPLNPPRHSHRSFPPYETGRGGGIRTPTLGFGDRWSTVEPTPLPLGSLNRILRRPDLQRTVATLDHVTKPNLF